MLEPVGNTQRVTDIARDRRCLKSEKLGPSLMWVPTFSWVIPPGALPCSQGEDQRKILSRFNQGEGKSKHFGLSPEHSILSNSGLPSRETILPEPKLPRFHQNLTSLGEGKCQIIAMFSPLISSERGEGNWEGHVQVTAQGYRLIKERKRDLITGL